MHLVTDMRFLHTLAGFTVVLGLAARADESAACSTASPECGPLALESSVALPANAAGIRARTPFAGYRVDPRSVALSSVRSDGSTFALAIAVSEVEPGVYDIVPEAGFEASATYTLSSTSPCGDERRDEISFATADAQALPAFEGKRLHAVVEAAPFTHFDTVACGPLTQHSRTAIITAPDVDIPWNDVLLYQWTVNGAPWIERSRERTARFSQSCESAWGSAVWSGGKGMRFWADPNLTVRLEIRLPGASSPLYIDSVQVDLTCTAAETGNVSAPDAGLAAPTLTASLDSENTLQTGQPGETEPSSDPDMAGCSMTRTPTPTSEIWTLLGGALLGLGARRRRRMHPHS